MNVGLKGPSYFSQMQVLTLTAEYKGNKTARRAKRNEAWLAGMFQLLSPPVLRVRAEQKDAADAEAMAAPCRRPQPPKFSNPPPFFINHPVSGIL